MKYIKLYENFNIGLFAIIESNKTYQINGNDLFLDKKHPDYPFLTHTFRKDKINIITSKDKNYLLNNLDFIKKLKKYNI